MYIRQLFAQKPCVFSMEVFPPKKTVGYEKLQASLRQMAQLKPDFVSVTYGAGGSAGGVSTCELASFLKNELGVEPLAHLICMGNEQDTIRPVLDELFAAGVQNILTLRGDRSPLRPESKSFAHASDLAAFIRANYGSFGLSGACYPEGHVESATLAEDVANLRLKQEAGVSHLITQLFFDNLHYYRFLNVARRTGVDLPVSAGVMPIVKKQQVERTVSLSSASLPPKFTKMISRWQDDEASLFEAGIEYAVEQIRDLIEGGADGVHLYVMNNPTVAAKVYDGIRDLLPAEN